jgi:L-threonine-O-3-phosphate decarboxylase
MPEHGGRLQPAVQRYGIPYEDWLDLSTGINPQSWLHQRRIDIPQQAWRRLPEEDDGLIEAARDYYGALALLPVAGSQAALQLLPSLRAPCRVGIPEPSYSEHARAWRRAGHAVTDLQARWSAASLSALDVLVLCNPNNPDGHRYAVDELLAWHAELGRRGGWLVVDEAFVDATPERSLAAFSVLDGLIVLRSLGKFFGLAGARVGFVLAAASWLEAMAERLGPWTVAGPSRVIARQALLDRDWQRGVRPQLQQAGLLLGELLHRNGLPVAGGCALFQWVPTPRAREIHESLARHGILTRLFDRPPGLRFGLPGTAAAWKRLENALQTLAEVPA